MSVMRTEMDNHDELRMEWDPFTDHQTTGLFFPGAGRAELAEQLLHLLRYGSSLTLLVGPSGVGKRNLLVHLLSQADRDLFDLAVVEATVMLEFAQLLSQLDEPWRSLRPFTPENYLELVPAVAAAADEESKTLVCVIVGAQQLSQDVLDQLHAMLGAAAGLPVKCLLLVDAAELEAVPALHALITALPDSTLLYLDPLDEEQTREYLQYRMHAAGLGEVSFSTEQVKRIFDASGGIIAQINGVARDVLLEALPAPKSARQKQPLPRMHIGALAVAVVVLLVLFMRQTPPEHASSQHDTHVVVLDNPVQPLTVPATNDQPFAEVARVAAEASTPSAAQVAGQEAALTAQIGPLSPPVAVSESTPVTVGAPASVGQEAAVVISNAPPAAVTTSQSDAAAARRIDDRPAPVMAAQPTAPVVAAKPAIKTETPAAKPAAIDPRANWLLGLSKDHFVLQLLGAQEETTVKRFLAQYPSLRKVTYYKTWRQGKPWYVVVQGDYPSRDAARAAIAQLPASLQQQNPWIRSVAEIHQQLGQR